MMKNLSVLVIGVLLLSGCATPYQSFHGIPILNTLTGKAWGGYTDSKIQDGIYRVTFHGNSATSPEKVEDLTMLRSSELTLKNGYRYFIITFAQPRVTTIADGNGGISSAHSMTYQITCFTERPTDSPVIVYDAEEISRNMKTQYGMKLEASEKVGGSLDRAIWDEFAGDTKRLRDTAAAIVAGALSVPPPGDVQDAAIDEDEEFPEGRLLTQMHKRRERNPQASRKKKRLVLKATGTLACEACGFDFAATYQTLGQGFAECHHRKPVSELTKGKTTKLKDLAIVCANCHRMLHRARPWKTVEELKVIIKGKGEMENRRE